MRILGVVLLVAGVIALAYGGFGYDRQRTIIDMGPMHATATEHHAFPVSPVVGGVLVLGGVLLLIMRRRRVV